MTTCPCCGSKFEGDLRVEGCSACGARAVGPPLARPERELPSYGWALLAAASGVILFLVFASSMLVALVERESSSFGFWNLMAAAETAAWRLKLLVLPVSLFAVWMCARIHAKMRREPERFVGGKFARAGLALAAFVAFAIVALIGVTVPERLRQRELALKAADNALLYAAARILNEYRAQHDTYAFKLEYLEQMPDPDGSVARVLAEIRSGEYLPSTDLAALAPKSVKGRGRRRAGAIVRTTDVSARINTDDAGGAGLPFTNYELVLPGRDKILGTPDDLMLRDGHIVEPSPSPRQPRRAAPAGGKVSAP